MTGDMMLPRVIPRDPQLPQLSIALDPERMACEFERSFAAANGSAGHPTGGHLNVESCSIKRIKYKPGNNCLIHYQLKVRNRRTGARDAQILCGRIYQAGESRPHFDKAALRPVVPPRLGPPLLHIEPLGMVAWAFPNDRKLQGLPALTDARRLKDDLLPEVVESRWGAAWGIEDVLPRLVHFVPEHTCCVRVDLRLAHRVNRKTRPWVIFGKTYYNEKGEEAHANMRQLWASGVRRCGKLNVPRPLGYRPAARLLWQEGLPGRTLLEHCRDGNLSRPLVEQVGKAIAGLHRAGINCPRESGIEEILKRLGEVQKLLAGVRPSSASAVAGIVARLTAQAPILNRGAVAILHGDLHPKNIFVNEGEVSIIDLDDISRGPPLRDIGAFIAALLNRQMLAGAPQSDTGRMIGYFIEKYRAHVPWPTPRAEINWYTAAALVIERGFRSATRLKPGQFEILDDLMAKADEISRGTEDVLELACHA
jgi:tRNA A-37 threonylcarbamoyl transferase component Bud32